MLLNNLSEAWLEITAIPSLLVMSAFLGGRLATSSEINRRFLLLVMSTLVAACTEAIIRIFGGIHTINMNVFYAIININAYCLMAYVAAYTRTSSKSLIDTNFFLLCISLVLLFFFGKNNSAFLNISPVFAVAFVVEAFILQLVHQEFYGNGQFIVMNTLFILLIDAFLLQYLFNFNTALVYPAATLMLVFTFFYLEAPTYKQLISAHIEIDNARIYAEKSIQQANLANKAKSNFLASTSHEIRTPMNAILGINDMILAENPDPDTRRASLDIKRAGEYLLALVNNILDISKIEAGKMDLYETDYHLWELLKDCEAFMTDALALKHYVKFSINVSKNIQEHLHGDVLRLKQAVTNLLSNSAKYTEKGYISLSVSGERKKGSEFLLKVVVEDTGIGMHDDDLMKIYEPFERANISETRHIPGAGLGLTLVKNIIGIMSGRISVISSYGKGTAFTLEVPQRLASGQPMTIQEYENLLSSQPEINPAQNISPSVWPDARILVVDDTPVNLVVAKGMLKSSEAEIDTAESGEQALELIKANHYDLVFLDHNMPGMDGVQTLQHAKAISPNTKYIALTANLEADSRDKYIALGFDDYLPKPFKSEQMTALLKACL
ncbi:MAG: response regulator [Synergistaceae bacterium]|nr:response regulator [Synergistaceae bacterium]